MISNKYKYQLITITLRIMFFYKTDTMNYPKKPGFNLFQICTKPFQTRAIFIEFFFDRSERTPGRNPRSLRLRNHWGVSHLCQVSTTSTREA